MNRVLAVCLAIIVGANAALSVAASLQGHPLQYAVAAAILFFGSYGVYRLIRRWWPEPADIPPESLYDVRVADGVLTLSHPVEGVQSIPLATIEAVTLDTDAGGPGGDDFRWRLDGPDGVVVVALGATGEQALVDWMKSLPGFDEDRFAAAIRSRTIGTFPVWVRG